MNYKFYTLDVFTSQVFSGNQLAVFPEAQGLTTSLMAKIAIEFNFSETVFVFPAENDSMNYRLRIFTPGGEIPFAGHPTIGTAYLLAHLGMVIIKNDLHEMVLGENVGNVPVVIESEKNKPVYTALKAPNPPTFFSEVPSNQNIADILSLSLNDLDSHYQPQGVSCGLPFLIIPVNSLEALSQAKVNLSLWQEKLSNYVAPHLYPCYKIDECHWQVRMFAPGLNITEDPATGSAATAFAGYLASYESARDGVFSYDISQGKEINRPSEIIAIATKKENQITEILVKGKSVIVTEGFLLI
jgi:trans-2,3-dihydro-3-hydroxyanthranilate isomerase